MLGNQECNIKQKHQQAEPWCDAQGPWHLLASPHDEVELTWHLGRCLLVFQSEKQISQFWQLHWLVSCQKGDLMPLQYRLIQGTHQLPKYSPCRGIGLESRSAMPPWSRQAAEYVPPRGKLTRLAMEAIGLGTTRIS